MSRLENDQRRRDASLREYRQHLEMIDTISRNGKTRTQREQEDRQAAIAHFQELWAGWEMPSGSGKSPSGTGKAEEVTLLVINAANGPAQSSASKFGECLGKKCRKFLPAEPERRRTNFSSHYCSQNFCSCQFQSLENAWERNTSLKRLRVRSVRSPKLR